MGALKHTEISDKHARASSLANAITAPPILVTAEIPVFAVVTGDEEQAPKTVGNVKEDEAIPMMLALRKRVPLRVPNLRSNTLNVLLGVDYRLTNTSLTTVFE